MRSRWLGVLAAAGSIALTTALLFPLEDIAPAVSLGVVYLLPVLLVSIVWGLWLGLATSLAAALAFNFFHIPPTGRFTIATAENWVALAVFVVVAAVASTLSELAGARARDAERRRREADLAAELARLLLGTPEPRAALPGAAKRIADALEIDSVAIVPDRVEGDERHVAIPLGEHGTLVVPAAAEGVARERVAPALEALHRRRARARTSHARGRGDERAAPQRRDQDRRPAVGLARPALAADRDRRRRRRARRRPRSPRPTAPSSATRSCTRARG